MSPVEGADAARIRGNQLEAHLVGTRLLEHEAHARHRSVLALDVPKPHHGLHLAPTVEAAAGSDVFGDDLLGRERYGGWQNTLQRVRRLGRGESDVGQHESGYG